MPIVYKNFQVVSARELLFARCPRCECILNWVHEIGVAFHAGASCCEYAFEALLNPEGKGPTEFRLYAEPVNWGDNVKPIFG
jgi:hypothetical protein